MSLGDLLLDIARAIFGEMVKARNESKIKTIVEQEVRVAFVEYMARTQPPSTSIQVDAQTVNIIVQNVYSVAGAAGFPVSDGVIRLGPSAVPLIPVPRLIDLARLQPPPTLVTVARPIVAVPLQANIYPIQILPSPKPVEVVWFQPSPTPVTIPAPIVITSPRANIESIGDDHNVYEGFEKGMRIRLKFTVDNLKDQAVHVAAYFFLADGTVLTDHNEKHRAPDGQVAVGSQCVPLHTSTIFNDYSLFMPYSELHLIQGQYSCKFYVRIYDLSRRIALAQSGYREFWINI